MTQVIPCGKNHEGSGGPGCIFKVLLLMPMTGLTHPTGIRDVGAQRRLIGRNARARKDPACLSVAIYPSHAK